ncbi:hypothetical protein SORBI_3005G024500 [Sorghum bicolor]|uniref:DUF4283 domain-containing protein n=1 Tax=Sorghum bicolor TaxID=4558 RepID=C5Y418_SORBI|nr:hypothetical protein SORBI_3005G024500 [Sorghum bicolor]
MALPGAPQLRPMETAATAATNTAMEEELQRLSRCAMVACLCRERDDVSPEEVKRMLCTKLGVLDRDIKVTRHRPEDFLIVFEHQHHRDAALDMRRPQVGSIGIRFLPWRILPYSDRIELRHHVRLCLEGIPAHAWNESIAKRTIARACDIDYMEGRSIRRDDTRALYLWAWTHDPSDIPKVTWLTLTGGSAVVHEGAAPPRGRCGLTFRVLVHLDIVEPPPDEYGNSIARTIDWRYGVVDGERIPRERRDPPPDASRDRRRDDDDDRRGRRSDKNRGWGSRMFRSLSRAPNRDRERERSASRQGRRHDAASSTGGRRRASSQGSPSGLNKACREVQTPAPAPEPQRGRSVERSSPWRGGHVQRSPPRDVARQQDHGSPPRALDSPRLRDTRAPHQDERGETLRPSFARFKPGRVFTRRPRNDKASATPPPPEDAAITAPYTAPPAVTRFKPGRHYTRRPRGPGGVRPHRRGTSQASAAPHEAKGGTRAEAFLSTIARPVSPALLRLPTDRGDARRRRKTPPAHRGVRRSARIATRAWPRGNTVDCARQILMKRLGVMEEKDDQFTDDQFLRYVQLFQGHLDDTAIAALTSLCGLEDPPNLEIGQV